MRCISVTDTNMRTILPFLVDNLLGSGYMVWSIAGQVVGWRHRPATIPEALGIRSLHGASGSHDAQEVWLFFRLHLLRAPPYECLLPSTHLCSVVSVPSLSVSATSSRILVAAPTLGVECAYVDGQIGQASTIPSRPVGGMRRGRRNTPPLATS